MKALPILMMGGKKKLGYGLLYNWLAASHPNIAPTGYHTPTLAEFQALSTELGGDSVAGGILKKTGTDFWDSPNTGSLDTYGFSAFGGGRRDSEGSFIELKTNGYFWASNSISDTAGIALVLSYNSAGISLSNNDKLSGFSLRFIKDNTTDEGSITDYDGNVYNTITIGSQVWTTSNFKGIHYNDGTLIENVTSAARWIKMDTVIPDYGHLYVLDAFNPVDIEPNTDWRVPNDADFNTLVSNLGGATLAGGALKIDNKAFWGDTNVMGTPSDFDAIGTGYKSGSSIIDYRYSSRFCIAAPEILMNGIYIYGHTAAVTRVTMIGSYGFSLRFLWQGVGAAPPTVTDIQGNIYPTVQIGTQYWTAKNFKCTKDRDNVDLTGVTNTDTFAAYKAGVYSAYNNDLSLI